jgi:hypothetical protein
MIQNRAINPPEGRDRSAHQSLTVLRRSERLPNRKTYIVSIALRHQSLSLLRRRAVVEHHLCPSPPKHPNRRRPDSTRTTRNQGDLPSQRHRDTRVTAIQHRLDLSNQSS